MGLNPRNASCTGQRKRTSVGPVASASPTVRRDDDAGGMELCTAAIQLALRRS
ncbi:MAG: hypothetical protein ACTHK7_13745 [Aureliella sp.]